MNPDSSPVLVIALLILAGGLLSMAEFAIISSRPTRLHELKAAGYQAAGLVLGLLDNPGRFLSAIQSMITLVMILTGAYCGLAFSPPLARLLETVPELTRYSPGIAFTLVALLATFVSLVAGKLVPKKIALQHPEAIAVRIAPFMDLLARLASPMLGLVNSSTAVMLKMLGVDPSEAPMVSDEDVMLMIRQGAKKGVFESVEYDMISRIFRMSDKRASSIMTPRNEIEWLDLEEPEEKLIARIKASGRSQFPVADGRLDQVCGVVRALDLVSLLLARPGSVKESIRAAMKTPLFVPESVPAFHVLEVFRKNRTHLALVIDEHGSVQGAITLTDVLESIVGDVPADDPEVGRKIVQRSRRTWIVDGMLPVDEFASAFGLDIETFRGEDEPRYDTMGGFMMHRLGEVPSVSDSIEWNGIQFKVIKMDGQRVARLLIELTEASAARITAKQEER
ncbi:MAG: HlyC/CorC family transporter [Chlorobiaceae bacterium]|nr:HlyC/CorC family transporter [Chlorobiaceae bacterium]